MKKIESESLCLDTSFGTELHQLDQVPHVGLLTHSTSPYLSKSATLSACPGPGVLPSLAVGLAGGGEGGERREEEGIDTELHHVHLQCPLPKPEGCKGEKGCRVQYLFSLEHERNGSHSPFPFSGGVYFNQQPLPHLPCACVYTHTVAGRGDGLTSPLNLFSLEEGLTKGKEGATAGRGFSCGTERRDSSTKARREWKRAQLLCFLKILIIWGRVVSNFQNTLQSPTFHTAPFLTALWFFRQNLRALVKPEALGAPQCTQAQCSLPSLPRPGPAALASPYTPHGSVARWL